MVVIASCLGKCGCVDGDVCSLILSVRPFRQGISHVLLVLKMGCSDIYHVDSWGSYSCLSGKFWFLEHFNDVNEPIFRMIGIGPN